MSKCKGIPILLQEQTLPSQSTTMQDEICFREEFHEELHEGFCCDHEHDAISSLHSSLRESNEHQDEISSSPAMEAVISCGTRSV